MKNSEIAWAVLAYALLLLLIGVVVTNKLEQEFVLGMAKAGYQQKCADHTSADLSGYSFPCRSHVWVQADTVIGLNVERER